MLTIEAAELKRILKQRLLYPHFQAIVDTQRNQTIGFEALIRGPKGSILQFPDKLFRAASEYNLLFETEMLCRELSIQKFANSAHSNSLLFLNISPQVLQDSQNNRPLTRALVAQSGLSCSQIVIELSEKYSIDNPELLGSAMQHYRDCGFKVAIDDVGSGFSSLQLWSELRPDIAKIDRYFVAGVDSDPIKQEFVRAMINLGRRTSTQIIVEGVETLSEFKSLTLLGMSLAQGYLFGRPTPELAMAGKALKKITSEQLTSLYYNASSAQELLLEAPALDQDISTEQALEMLKSNDQFASLALIDANKRPLGMVNRETLLQLFSGNFGRSLHGRDKVAEYVDTSIKIVDVHTSLEQLSQEVSEQSEQHWYFVIVENGKYLGLGSLSDLLKRLTELKLQSARYANPLTMLPGNVPIFNEIDMLLARADSFYVAYFDLNNFKPYNDCYGYSRGDQVLQLLSQLLVQHCAKQNNFVGHIGGDDFVVIFHNQNCQMICEKVIEQFNQKITDYYNSYDRNRGGIVGLSRKGERSFFPLLSLAVGIVHPDSKRCRSFHDVADLASSAKSMAKKLEHGGVFLSRRRSTNSLDADPLEKPGHLLINV